MDKDKSWFDPHKSFVSLGVVRIVLVTILTISSASAYFIFKHANLELDLSSAGFDFFISTFRFLWQLPHKGYYLLFILTIQIRN